MQERKREGKKKRIKQLRKGKRGRGKEKYVSEDLLAKVRSLVLMETPIHPVLSKVPENRKP